MDIKAFKEKYEHKPVAENLNNVSNKPLVSVCVQTYQHVNYIEACLEGILKQETNFEFEILLGEDASTDGTREICVKYAEKYPDKIRLFLHHRENNINIEGKPTGRFNFVYNLYSANGKYIAFCEGDDYWTDPLKLQKQVSFLENNLDYVLTGHNAKIIDSAGNILKESKLPNFAKKDASEYELKKGFWVLTLTMCFRNVVRDIPSEFFKVTNADTFLTSLLGNHGKYKFMQDVKPGIYRLHSGGFWSAESTLNRLKQSTNTFREISKYYERIGDIEFAKKVKPSKLAVWIKLYKKIGFKLFEF